MIFSIKKNISNPIFICGCHGSGTSFVVKMLRYNGFQAGMDSGEITRRKVHESKAFSQTNEHEILQKISSDLPFGMRTTDIKAWEIFEKFIEDEKNIERISKTLKIETILEKFWGVNKFSKLITDKSKFQKVWGWKDPRNSITMPFWYKHFPDMRVLVIQQDWVKPNVEGKSKSGSWFKFDSDETTRSRYMNPSFLKKIDNDVKYFNFKNVTNREEINKLMSWTGLKELSEVEFEKLLYEVGYER